MRAIDADALINELNNSHYPGAPYVDAGISIAIGKVCDAPTIEPQRKKVTNMRCIDADALRDRLQNLGYDDWNQGTTTTWAEAFIECADMVDEQPTIEPRCEVCEAFNKTRLLIPQPERKKGKWIDAVLPNDNGGLPVQVCDQCNTFFPLAYTGGGHRFCPNCGAEMREEGDADEGD